MQKLRIGVLMGGMSLEKEVSFNSGRTICDHVDTTRYDVIPLYQNSSHLYLLPWHFLHRGKTTDFEHRLAHEAELIVWDDLKKRIDFIFIAQHGRYAEDGTLQGLLTVLDIPYLGSGIFASAVRMDKIAQKKFLGIAGIATPAYTVIEPDEIEHFALHKTTIIEKIKKIGPGNSFVVKPHNEGSSFGISVINDLPFDTTVHPECRSASGVSKDQGERGKKSDFPNLEQALLYACHIEQGKKKRVIVEEKINGMEFTCIILVDYKTGDYIPLPPTEIVPETGTDFLDYEQKYMPGRGNKFTPARCSAQQIKEIQQTCIATMKALEFTTIGRIDGFVKPDGTVIIIDPNSLSGLGPSGFIFNQAACIGMSHSRLINHLIETELHNYAMLQTVIDTEKKEEIGMDKKKIGVAVLLGGRSHEKETSLDSGRNIFYKLSSHTYEPIAIFVNNQLQLYRITQAQLVRNSTKEIENLLEQEQKINWADLPRIADFVFIALHGGEGENGSVQGALEMLNLPYNGSSILTSALCMDKFKTAQFLRAQGFDVPRNILIRKTEWDADQETVCKHIEETLSYPLIAKPHDDGCSVMVQKADTIDELKDRSNLIFSHQKEMVLIEEFIKGMELTVGVIGNENPQALPPSHIIAKKEILSIEEKFLPGAGENQTPAQLPHDTINFIQNIIKQVYKSVGCKGYARIDCFYQSAQESPTGNERLVILEINTLPGMTPATAIFHQAAEIGLKPMEFIDQIIQLGFEECNATSKMRSYPAKLIPETGREP